MISNANDRENFAQLQLRRTNYKLKWLESKIDACEKFQELAMNTYDFIISHRADFILTFDPWPESSGNGLWGHWGKGPNGADIPLPKYLMERWREWNDEYYVLRSRSPKLELRDLMQNISESHDASSWPSGYERKIQDWVDAGDPFARPPFDDRANIVTEELFWQLVHLRNLLNGWMFWDNKIGEVRFASEPEWQMIKTVQEKSELRQRQKDQISRLSSENIADRLPKILALARTDQEFWSALQEWEGCREASRPAEQEAPTVPRMVGPLKICKAPPEEQTKHDNPPMDALFVRFFERVLEPNDVITPLMLVISLRAEVRRELGYDNVLSWVGGPSFGEA